MALAFTFRLELEDGSPADPPTFRTAVLTWKPGDRIPLGPRTLRVLGVRDDDADQPPALGRRGPARDRPLALRLTFRRFERALAACVTLRRSLYLFSVAHGS
jgi:hypothetical protein